MKKFTKWVVGTIVLFISVCLNGLLAMLLINPVFGLTIGFWGWFGVAFVLTEIVSSGVSLHKQTQ